LLGIIAFRMRQPLPPRKRLLLHFVAGGMLHGVYLTVSWWAVYQGLSAGIMSLLGALQPLMVAVASVLFLRERLLGRAWVGLAIAIVGVVCVLVPAIERSGGDSVAILPAVAGLVAVIAMAGGTLIQRGSISGDGIWISGAVQNAGGAAVAMLAAAIVGEYRWTNSPILWGGLAWSAIILSVSGLSLLVWLVRTQGATRMSMLLLLVPPLAAIEAWALFGETLGPVQLLGFALALGGVLLGRSQGRSKDISEPA
jgi:drug/metabolite transporter (DMT)-like permease